MPVVNADALLDGSWRQVLRDTVFGEGPLGCRCRVETAGSAVRRAELYVTDYNDLARSRGKEAVREELAPALGLAPKQEAKQQQVRQQEQVRQQAPSRQREGVRMRR